MAKVHAEAAPRTAGESLAPPVSGIGILAWLRQNLFSTWYNTLLTLLCLWFLWEVVPPLVRWALLDADFIGTSREDCVSGGACWVFIKARFWQFMYGFYPVDQRWRVNTAFLILILALVPLFVPQVRHKLRARRRHSGDLSDRRLLPVLRRRPRPSGGPDRALGRIVPDPGDRRRRHRGILAARHPVRPGPALGHAGGAGGVHHVHRGDARRAPDHDPVHGLGDAPAVSAGRREFRQASQSFGRGCSVRGCIHGGGGPRRPAGDPEGPVRGRPGARPELLENDGPDHSAPGAAES